MMEEKCKKDDLQKKKDDGEDEEDGGGGAEDAGPKELRTRPKLMAARTRPEPKRPKNLKRLCHIRRRLMRHVPHS